MTYLIYLVLGVLAVLVFPKPIKESMMFAFDGVPRWKYFGFACLLSVLCVLLFPLYLVVVFDYWKSSQPMTDKQIEAWCELDRRDALKKTRKERVGRLKRLRGISSTPVQRQRYKRFRLQYIRKELRKSGLKGLRIPQEELWRYPAHLRKRIAKGGIWTPLIKNVPKHESRVRRRGCCVI